MSKLISQVGDYVYETSNFERGKGLALRTMGVICITNEGGIGEWCIVELQGEFIGNDADAILGNISIGKDGEAGMLIGRHEFKGSVTTLPKSFIVMEKEQDKESMGIKGIVRRKIIFNSRPKIICS